MAKKNFKSALGDFPMEEEMEVVKQKETKPIEQPKSTDVARETTKLEKVERVRDGVRGTRLQCILSASMDERLRQFIDEYNAQGIDAERLSKNEVIAIALNEFFEKRGR